MRNFSAAAMAGQKYISRYQMMKPRESVCYTRESHTHTDRLCMRLIRNHHRGSRRAEPTCGLAASGPPFKGLLSLQIVRAENSGTWGRVNI